MEKFTLTTIAILLFASVTKAQITKGSLYLGGSIGTSSTKQENSNSPVEGKSKSFSVNPAVGIAIKNNLIAGVDLNYIHGTTREFLNNQDNDRNGYGAGIFLRKYFSISNRFYVFGQTGAGYFSQKNEYLASPSPNYSYASTSKQHSASVNIYPGVAIHVFKSLYMEAAFNNLLQIGYSNSTTEGSFLFHLFAKTKRFFNSKQSVKWLLPEYRRKIHHPQKIIFIYGNEIAALCCNFFVDKNIPYVLAFIARHC